MTLPGVEFLRRFLLHVLPHRFVRLRHYGLHAASNVRTKLARARAMLDVRQDAQAPRNETTTPRVEPSPTTSTNAPPQNEPWRETIRRHTGVDVQACPRCKTGRLSRIPLALEPERARAPPNAS